MLASQAVSVSCPCKLLVQVARTSCLCTLSAQVVSALACASCLHKLSVQVVPASFLCGLAVCNVYANSTCGPCGHVASARCPRKSPVQVGRAHCMRALPGHVARASCVCAHCHSAWSVRAGCASRLCRFASTRALRILRVQVARAPCHDILPVLVGGARCLRVPPGHIVSAPRLRNVYVRAVCVC